jgi:hypothetical protein
MDGVLAVGPHRDTEWHQPIFRTFSEVPEEFGHIREAGVSLHLVTAKVEVEAAQVLRAIGLHDHFDSIIGADRLFWPSLWSAARKGRLPGSLAKSACRRILAANEGRPVVMIEDQAHNLIEMLAAGAIDFGILVPPFTRSGNRVDEWFDLNLALRLARELTTEAVDLRGLTGSGITASYPRQLPDGSVELQDMTASAGGAGFFLHLPVRKPFDDIQSPFLALINTGQDLIPSRRNAISIARSGNRFIRRMIRPAIQRGAEGNSRDGSPPVTPA